MSIRQRYSERLEFLQSEVLRMATLTATMIEEATRCLVDRQADLFDTIMHREETIDRMDLEIEGECTLLIATQQPVARDLRVVGSIMKMIADIERMADYAVDIAKVGRKHARHAPVKPYRDLPEMSRLVRSMLHDMLQCFARHDAAGAREVASRDEEIDILYRSIRDELAQVLVGKTEEEIAQGMDVLLSARHLERIADHTVNIGERIVYMMTGVLEELDP